MKEAQFLMKVFKKIHYAWFVCAGCAIMMFCSAGLLGNASAVYQPFILSCNHFTNAQTSLIPTFRNIACLFAMLTVRKYYQRFSLRTGMALAGCIVVLSLVLFAFSKNLVMYYISSVVGGFGTGFGYSVPMAILLEHWFLEKRNTAISICSAATGLAIFGIPTLITNVIERFGLKYAYLFEAAAVAVLVFISFLLIRSKPEDIGTTPYGKAPEARTAARNSIGIVHSDWYILVPFLLLLGAVMNTSYSHLTVLMNGEGFSSSTIAIAVSISGVSMMFGKILYGRLCDRLGVYRCNYIFIPSLILGLVLCCFIRLGTTVLFLAMIFISIGISFLSVGLSSWVPALASAKDYDSTIQRFQLWNYVGTIIFSPFVGIIADRSGGSYIPAYEIFSLMGVAVVVVLQYCLLRIRRRRRRAVA